MAGDSADRSAQALQNLPPDEWDVIDGICWRGRRFAEVDQIAVGRAGVFVIDTKDWPGEVTVSNGVVRHDGRRRDGAVIAAAETAYAVARLIPDVPPTHVHGVLCVVGDHHITGWAHGTLLCSTRNAATMLAARPPVLADSVREDVVRRLREQAEVPSPSPPKALAGHRPRLPASFIGSLVGGVIALAILLAVANPDIADKVGDLVVSIVGSDDSSQHQHQHQHDR